MQKLEKRIATLEQAATTNERVTHIFIVPMGAEDGIQTISGQGKKWERQDGETAKQFQDRVASDSPMQGKGVALFSCD
jgi:hypothetical protein